MVFRFSYGCNFQNYLGSWPYLVKRGSLEVSQRFFARRWERQTTPLLRENPSTVLVQVAVLMTSPKLSKSHIMPLDFPLLLDRHTEAAKAWQVRVLPTSFVLGQDGKIRYRAVGMLDWGRRAGRQAACGALSTALTLLSSVLAPPAGSRAPGAPLARGGSTLRSAPDQGLGQRSAATAGAGHAPQDGVWVPTRGDVGGMPRGKVEGESSNWISNGQRCRPLKRHPSVARTAPTRPRAT